MTKYLNNLKTLPLLVKLPFLVILIIIIYFLVTFSVSIYTENKINEEVKNFRFQVDMVYFESRFDRRSYRDKFLTIRTLTSVSKEQFSKMTFSIPQEEVRAELINDKEIKVYFLSEFRKNINSKVTVYFHKKQIYKFDFSNSIFDEQDEKNNPIREVNLY